MADDDREFRRVCVFAGSNAGNRPEYAAAARALGEVIAAEGLDLVYGGSTVGLMGELAGAVLEHGGHVFGVTVTALRDKEPPNTDIPDLIVVASMHQRKQQMADMSDAFIALPGGLGALEQFFEIATWEQLGFHTKPCGLLNVAGYFDSLATFLDHAVREGFIAEPHRQMILIDDDPRRLLERLRAYRPGEAESWIGRTNR
ncbi:MAG TPA: TIGR00730 family Rossman fold protein [Gemmatimonadales bacterium]|nr:TIGR00730 family Rossman fold protein [Gemmatimonadales bacterium]